MTNSCVFPDSLATVAVARSRVVTLMPLLPPAPATRLKPLLLLPLLFPPRTSAPASKFPEAMPVQERGADSGTSCCRYTAVRKSVQDLQLAEGGSGGELPSGREPEESVNITMQLADGSGGEGGEGRGGEGGKGR